jgi:hypothetical protein
MKVIILRKWHDDSIFIKGRKNKAYTAIRRAK